jgi:hypothetical protein
MDDWGHLTSRGNEGRLIFSDDEERRHFLQLLERQSDRFRLRLQAYVLMDNHCHLLLETVESNLSRAYAGLGALRVEAEGAGGARRRDRLRDGERGHWAIPPSGQGGCRTSAP